MGKFDGYLICSDVDGTFHCGDGTIEGNSEAVRYFTENGGRFTFCTGRSAAYLLRPDLNRVMNAPACLFNGSLVYDYRDQRILAQKRLDRTLGEYMEALQPWWEDMEGFSACDQYDGEHIPVKNPSPETPPDLTMFPLKLLFVFKTPEKADAFQAEVTGLPCTQNVFVCKSWSVGVEFIPADGTKGHALERIKAHLGNIHTAIGIGDYENDIPMLTHADIGVAVGNAIPQVKAAADYVLTDARECAIRQLIEMLDRGEL